MNATRHSGTDERRTEGREGGRAAPSPSNFPSSVLVRPSACPIRATYFTIASSSFSAPPKVKTETMGRGRKVRRTEERKEAHLPII